MPWRRNLLYGHIRIPRPLAWRQQVSLRVAPRPIRHATSMMDSAAMPRTAWSRRAAVVSRKSPVTRPLVRRAEALQTVPAQCVSLARTRHCHPTSNLPCHHFRLSFADVQPYIALTSPFCPFSIASPRARGGPLDILGISFPAWQCRV